MLKLILIAHLLLATVLQPLAAADMFGIESSPDPVTSGNPDSHCDDSFDHGSTGCPMMDAACQCDINLVWPARNLQAELCYLADEPPMYFSYHYSLTAASPPLRPPRYS